MARRLGLMLMVSCIILAGFQQGGFAEEKAAGKEGSPAARMAGWQTLFDGKTLNGWKASENKGTFTVRDGMIVVHGERSHLFYVGPVADTNFTNFEFKADVMTKPGANSGIYFHTTYQETDWPKKGYEVQVNNTHSDWKKTGSLYDVENVRQPPSKDNEWFTQHIIVRGKRIIIKVNGITTVDWTEPENFSSEGWPGRRLSSGTFALQGHDPKSIVYFKNIMVKILPPGAPKKLKAVVVTGGHDFEHEPFFSLFKGYSDIEYVEAVQKDHSELFEDISKWDYDVIVLFNMTQNISPKRQENFIKLLNCGVGVVALHHSIGSFQEWPQYPKIIGSKYYLKETTEGGVTHAAATYKHDVDFAVHIENTKHPITRNLGDFKAHDEIYKNCGFEKDNQVLLTTDEASSDKTIGWVRQFGKAKVCCIQVGHGPSVYADPTYRQIVARAIRWSAGRLD
jgi:type 1 glutamine amidotransferase